MSNIQKVRIPWDIYECALLLDNTLSVFEKGQDKKKIILQLSNSLRQKAINSGIVIDQFYRNTNGITLQMQKMAFFVTDGKCGLPGGTKLFKELVEIYKNDLKAYEEILLEAREMCGIEKTNKERFFKWLCSRVSPAQLSELYMVYDDIDDFCRSRKITREYLFDITDLKILTNVRNTVETNKVFRMNYKKKLSRMYPAIRHYISYVKDECLSQIQTKSSNVDSSEKEENVDNKSGLELTNKNIEEIKVIEGGHQKIECEEIKNENIAELEICVEKSNEETSITTDLSEVQDYSFTTPISFEYFGQLYQTKNWKDLYVSCFKVLWKDYPQIFQSLSSGSELGDVWFCKQYEIQKYNIRTPKEIFDGYVTETNINATNLMHKLRTLIKRCNFDYENLVVTYIKKGELPQHHFLSAMNQVQEFVINSGVSNKFLNTAIPKNIAQKYTQLLEEDFPDGFRPMVIHLKKFKMIYENKFGEPLEIENDELTNALEQVGSNIDGRIFAKKSSEKIAIVKEIHDEIIELFNKGASCVFLECLMNKYQQELLSELGVYNEDVLADLLLSYGQTLYHRRNGCLQQEFETSNFSEDVLRVLRDNHSPMSYEEIHNKLWYLPMDKIKHILVTESALVNVDKETYFYAPNLPITEEELWTITNAMNQEIAEKGFMVAKDFPKLLERVVPVAAINTSEFKDWGLRNALGYILRDRFSFSTSLVCENGRTIEMWQAYRDYCKQFEKMTLEDLKKFSSLVNVQIYWNNVLQEMIRISPNELVRKDQIHFDVSAVDNVIDTICLGNYVPIKEVGLFLHFPAIEVAWNGFVLESYLLNFSEKFTLYHASISESDYYGVVVRRGLGLDSYTDVIVDMLTHSDEWQDKKTALELLVQKGYQARRHLGNIESLLKEATIRKEQIEKELERG